VYAVAYNKVFVFEFFEAFKLDFFGDSKNGPHRVPKQPTQKEKLY
jgi:hypothetical protein